MVLLTVVPSTANGALLLTLVAVWLDVPSLYTIVKGPVPALEVQVSSPAPVTQNGPLAVNPPTGNG